MKRIFLLLHLLAIGILSSCKKDQQPKPNSGILHGTYKLTGIAYGTDVTGSGEASFTDVTSEKTITVKADGTITSNGDLCYDETSIGNPTSGTYANGVITVTNCSETQYKAYGNLFIIGHTYLGTSRSRFVRIN
ncbi:hypothetical protein [Fluviicola sp.]|uniref:hypothetical protein n=1 Tax=Fluviicola sp. TaxID=1917219 RepID=UPI0031D17A6D